MSSEAGDGEQYQVDEEEIVHYDHTESSARPLLNHGILGHQCTNIQHFIRTEPEDIVHLVCTIYFGSAQGPRVIDYILENKAFTVPALRLVTGVKKRTAYDVLHRLWPWVKKTEHTVPHPNPRSPGPRPHVWIVDGLDEAQGIRKASEQYNSLQWQHDPELQRQEKLKSISASIAHQLIEKGIMIGDPNKILDLCKNIPVTQLHPSDRNTVARQVFTILRKRREGSS